jgi:lipoprotein-releasing system permease protein
MASRGLISLVAGRLVRREAGHPLVARRVAGIAGFVLGACLLSLLFGASHVVVPLLVFASSVTLLAAVGARLFNPMIAVSVIGIALGVASLFTVLSVTSGFEVELTRRIARLSGHVLLTKYGLDFNEYEELATEQETDSRVVMASPFVWGSAAIVREPEPGEPAREVEPVIGIVKALDPDHVSRSSLLLECLATGDPAKTLRPADPGLDPGAVLGHGLAQRLGVQVGDHIALVSPEALDGTRAAIGGPPKRARFEVTDLLDTGVSEFDSGMVLVHLTAGQSLLFGRKRVSGIEIELADPRQATAFAAQLDAGLNHGRRVPLYRAGTWEQYSQSTLAVIRQVRAVVSVVLGLMVLVAGGALVSSLLLLVRRKRRQIASLGAMGASGPRIFLIFEAAGILTGVYGVIAGLALGGVYAFVLARFRYPLDPDIYPIDHLPVAFSAWDLIVPSALAIAVCSIVSGPLALMAARVRPVEALRL